MDWDLVSCTTEQNYCSRGSKTQYTFDEQPGDALHFNSLGHFVRDTGTSSELQESSASSSPPPTPSYGKTEQAPLTALFLLLYPPIPK